MEVQAGPPEWLERPRAGPCEALVGPGVGTTATAAVLQARDPGSPSRGAGVLAQMDPIQLPLPGTRCPTSGNSNSNKQRFRP